MPVITRFGNLSTVAELRPVETLRTSIIVREVEAVRGAEGKCLGGRRERGGRQVVVEQLHRLALTGAGAHVEDVAGEGVEDRAVRLEDFGGPAEHQRDRAGPRAGDAARHRPVDVGDPGGSQQLLGLFSDRGTDRREVDDRRDPAVGGRGEVVRDRERRLAVGNADERGVCPCRHVGDVAALVRAGRQPICGAGGVEAHELEPRGRDPCRHRPAHVAEPDEAEHRRCHGAGSGVMPSASSTCRASRNASTPAGTPA